MATRTNKRSRSGAHVPCPDCGKRVRTAKGLAMHQAEVHPAPSELSGTKGKIILVDEIGTEHDANHPYGLEHPVLANG